MTLEITKYPNSIVSLRDDLNRAARGTVITALAQRLIDGAIAFDMYKARELELDWKYKGKVRNAANPTEFEHPSIVGVDWSDDALQKLEPGEQWHQGRRATQTGAVYLFDAFNRPINPYMNTGMSGRGTLGQFGPNHAVDNGIIVIKPTGDGTHKVYLSLGITRKYNNDAPAFAGGFAKYRKENGAYVFDDEAAMETRFEEFFEEMVSGSIVLLPEFAHQIGQRYEQTYNEIMAKRGGALMSSDQSNEIMEQIITGLKMEQVEKHDPGFMTRLKDHIRTAHECFAGPVLCDGRNTNTAWIESRLAWIVFNDDIWEKIRGPNPVFDYKLKGGDDSSGVVYHKIGPDLIKKAYASHGPMMVFMAASFLLHAQSMGMSIDSEVIKQMEDTADFLDQYRKPPPPPAPQILRP